MVTLEPSRSNACASSQPSGPPPITSNRGGSSVRSNTVALVRKPACLRPGTSGTSGRAPVAISAFSKVSGWPLTLSRSGPSNCGLPKYTSMPLATSWRTEVVLVRWLRMRRKRVIAAAKSSLISSGGRAP